MNSSSSSSETMFLAMLFFASFSYNWRPFLFPNLHFTLTRRIRIFRWIRGPDGGGRKHRFDNVNQYLAWTTQTLQGRIQDIVKGGHNNNYKHYFIKIIYLLTFIDNLIT